MNSFQNIGVFSPSSYVEKDEIEAARSLMDARGHSVFVHPQTFAHYHQSAGNVQDKLEA